MSVTSYIFIYLHIFLPTDVLESVWHDKCCQRLEAKLGTPWCNGFDDAADIVTDQTEAGCLCFLFHCAPKGCLKDKEASIKKDRPTDKPAGFLLIKKSVFFLTEKRHFWKSVRHCNQDKRKWICKTVIKEFTVPDCQFQNFYAGCNFICAFKLITSEKLRPRTNELSRLDRECSTNWSKTGQKRVWKI